MTARRVRDLQRSVERAGLDLTAPIASTNGNHLCVRVRNSHGVERCFHASLTPSDCKTATLEAANFRRFARQTESLRR